MIESIYKMDYSVVRQMAINTVDAEAYAWVSILCFRVASMWKSEKKVFLCDSHT